MTRVLIRILFLASIVTGGVLFSKQKQIVQNSEVVNDLENKKEQFQGSVKGVTDGINKQAQELTKRGQEVSEHVSNILEAYIEPTEKTQDSEIAAENNDSNENSSVSDQNKPIYEETLDYGRYLYCQQVIKDYEAQHP